MIQNGLTGIGPDSKDYSLLHTYGAVSPGPEGLPAGFSVYDGREIPNQNTVDLRFTPNLMPLPYGCTGESGSFDGGIQDGVLYSPEDLYLNTPPGTRDAGRDMRAMLKTQINRGLRKADGTFGPKRVAYFNCYGSSKIDDCDAARIALWINQYEKRGVYLGTWWYWVIAPDGILEEPNYITSQATLHCYLATGWKTINGEVYIEAIPWVGSSFGDNGKVYIRRDIYNKLMKQPYTGAFTITKISSGQNPVSVGLQANYDHIVYALVQFVRNLFNV